MIYCYPCKANVYIYVTARQFKRVCYFANWSNLRAHNQSRFYLSDIDLSLCTHILYAFAGIDVTNRQIKHTQAEDEYGTNKQGRYYDFTALKRTNPDLKTLLSVGGQDSDLAFSGIVTSPETIREFARNCRIYLYDRGFDGIDIGWEFPEAQNKDNLTELLRVSRKMISVISCINKSVSIQPYISYKRTRQLYLYSIPKEMHHLYVFTVVEKFHRP